MTLHEEETINKHRDPDNEFLNGLITILEGYGLSTRVERRLVEQEFIVVNAKRHCRITEKGRLLLSNNGYSYSEFINKRLHYARYKAGRLIDDGHLEVENGYYRLTQSGQFHDLKLIWDEFRSCHTTPHTSHLWAIPFNNVQVGNEEKAINDIENVYSHYVRMLENILQHSSPEEREEMNIPGESPFSEEEKILKEDLLKLNRLDRCYYID
jgi:hypothetical protein